MTVPGQGRSAASPEGVLQTEAPKQQHGPRLGASQPPRLQVQGRRAQQEPGRPGLHIRLGALGAVGRRGGEIVGEGEEPEIGLIFI